MTRFDLTGIGMTSARSRARLVDRLERNGIANKAVLDAIAAVPRHIFVDEALAHMAYRDNALPIGHGQTISQPSTIAMMTSALLDAPRSKVLEVGTGSGFQTAVLAHLCPSVYTVERMQPLLEQALERLQALNIHNVQARLGDGYLGWREQAPFAGILVTAAPRAAPQALLDQLAAGGRLIAPVGGDSTQELRVYDRTASGIREDVLHTAHFVPLVKGMEI